MDGRLARAHWVNLFAEKCHDILHIAQVEGILMKLLSDTEELNIQLEAARAIAVLGKFSQARLAFTALGTNLVSHF